MVMVRNSGNHGEVYLLPMLCSKDQKLSQVSFCGHGFWPGMAWVVAAHCDSILSL